MSFFVDSMRPNNGQGKLFFLLSFLTTEGFDDRETVIDGISLEVEAVMRYGKWMLATL